MARKTTLPKEMLRRSFAIFFVCIGVYLFLIYRTFNIQIVKGEEYKNKLEKQNTNKIELNNGRGTIYDRNNKPLTDTNTKTVLIVDRQKFFNDPDFKNLVEEAIDINNVKDKEDLVYDISSSLIEIEIDNLDFKLEKELEKNGVIVENRNYRYQENGLLSHTIGYISKSDNKGVSGIEKYQEDILNNSNEEYVSVFKAGQIGGNVDNKYVSNLNGTVKTVKKNEDAKHIRLTIDKDIQENLERVVDNEKNPSVAIISDVEKAEILAMTSRPNFDQYNIEDYLNSSNKDLMNRATQVTYQPASIFKIVVLYSALKNGIIDESYTYNCCGEEVVKNSDEKLKCIKHDGHGEQTLNEAFANSCNAAFLDIANKMDDKDIIDSAKELHLGELVNLGIEEVNGNVEKNTDSRNLPIGQGSIEVTPIQINQMTQIIANNGTYKPLKLYDSIIDDEKNIIKSFEVSNEEEIISPFIISKVKEAMKQVSQIGTAKDLNTLKKGSAVKTGTAQIKVNNTNTNNWLITGFYPESEPKYAITVIVEGTGNSENDTNKSAVPIFKNICEFLN